jgi:hypothetical protein
VGPAQLTPDAQQIVQVLQQGLHRCGLTLPGEQLLNPVQGLQSYVQQSCRWLRPAGLRWDKPAAQLAGAQGQGLQGMELAGELLPQAPQTAMVMAEGQQ